MDYRGLEERKRGRRAYGVSPHQQGEPRGAVHGFFGGGRWRCSWSATRRERRLAPPESPPKLSREHEDFTRQDGRSLLGIFAEDPQHAGYVLTWVGRKEGHAVPRVERMGPTAKRTEGSPEGSRAKTRRSPFARLVAGPVVA